MLCGINACEFYCFIIQVSGCDALWSYNENMSGSKSKSSRDLLCKDHNFAGFNLVFLIKRDVGSIQ